MNILATAPVLAQLENAYGAVGMWEAGSEMAWQAVLPTVATDYSLEYRVDHDLAQISEPDRTTIVHKFRTLVRGNRNRLHEEDTAAMNALWQFRGGQILEIPNATRDARLDSYVYLMKQGEQVVQGGMAVSGKYGTIDPSMLNEGLGRFVGVRGEIQLLVTLAVAMGQFNVNSDGLMRALKANGGKAEDLGWKKLNINWRRGYMILRDREAFQKDLEGYKLFARKYADGDMQMAYQIASNLLTTKEFEKLNWGKSIPLKKVDDVEKITHFLKMGLADGSLKGLEGYKRFARAHVDGDMFNAYLLAAALLNRKEFKRLDWGRPIPLRVDEVAPITNILRMGLADGSLKRIEGRDRFATAHTHGNRQLAGQLASALLTAREFKALDWLSPAPKEE